jgi:replication factor A1
MSEFELSEGFCAKANVVDSSGDIPGPPPVLQILSIKKIAGGAGNVTTDRHRVILSDGVQFMQAMLSTAANERVEDGTFRRNGVMTLTKWEPQNLMGSRCVRTVPPGFQTLTEIFFRILIIFGMEPVGYPPEKIGTPAKVGKPATAAADDSMAVDKPAISVAPTSTAPPPRPAPPSASASKVADKVGPIFPIEGLNPYHNKSVSLDS